MSSKAKDILKMDLYGLLGVESTATPKEVGKFDLLYSWSGLTKKASKCI